MALKEILKSWNLNLQPAVPADIQLIAARLQRFHIKTPSLLSEYCFLIFVFIYILCQIIG